VRPFASTISVLIFVSLIKSSQIGQIISDESPA